MKNLNSLAKNSILFLLPIFFVCFFTFQRASTNEENFFKNIETFEEVKTIVDTAIEKVNDKKSILLVLDVDQTIIGHCDEYYQVRKKLRKRKAQETLSSQEEIYYGSIAIRDHAVFPIDPTFSSWIQKTKDLGIETIGLSAAMTTNFGKIKDLVKFRFEQMDRCGLADVFAHNTLGVEDNKEFVVEHDGKKETFLFSNGSILTNRIPLKIPVKKDGHVVTLQGKGLCLTKFLEHCPQKFSTIIFVDDSLKHSQEVYNALSLKEIDFTVIHQTIVTTQHKKTLENMSNIEKKLYEEKIDTMIAAVLEKEEWLKELDTPASTAPKQK